MDPPPPPPPPHGSNAQPGSRSGGLPDGKYDIFVVPPSSAGSGFLYLPSLNTQRNSFLAGVVCTAAVFFIYQTIVPLAKEWFNSTINGGGSGVLMLIIGVGVISWAFGKTQGEGSSNNSSSSRPPPAGGASNTYSQTPGGGYAGSPPPHSGAPPHASSTPPPKSSWQRPDGKSSWDKAREETRKREEQKRREEELKRRKEELEKAKKQERDKEARERLERELRERRERELKELREKREKEDSERKEREERLKREKEHKERADAAKAKSASASGSPRKPPGPTARTEKDEDAYSFRPYDRAREGKANGSGSAGSVYSEDSYPASATTAKTTPPPSARGPYTTKDPDKIIIKAVYSFNNAFMRTPLAQLVSGSGQVTDGLILRITTEGLFIDDDVRGVPQREWDVKAWTMKLAESCETSGFHVLRASIRDQEGKKYVFILSQSEGWKVAVGLQRLRRGSQVRALGVAGMPQNEAKALLENLGFS